MIASLGIGRINVYMHEHKDTISKTPYFCFESGTQSEKSRKEKKKIWQRSNFTSFVSSDSKIQNRKHEVTKGAEDLAHTKSYRKHLSKMASELISIFLGLQWWSPALLPCPFLHRSNSNRLESTPLQHFSFSWHEEVSDSVLTCTASFQRSCKQIPTGHTKIISLLWSK